jgi:hypothetical protein
VVREDNRQTCTTQHSIYNICTILSNYITTTKDNRVTVSSNPLLVSSIVISMTLSLTPFVWPIKSHFVRLVYVSTYTSSSKTTTMKPNAQVRLQLSVICYQLSKQLMNRSIECKARLQAFKNSLKLRKICMISRTSRLFNCIYSKIKCLTMLMLWLIVNSSTWNNILMARKSFTLLK